MFLFFSEAQAQYNLMQPIKGLGTGQTVSSYVPTIIMLGIALAALLAVVVIVVAGFMYITAAGNPGNVEKAKSYLLNAIIGLLIAIGYWLILQAINPDILKGELGALESAPAGQATATGGGGATEPVGGGGGANPEGETMLYIPGGEPNQDPSSVPWQPANVNWRGADTEEDLYVDDSTADADQWSWLETLPPTPIIPPEPEPDSFILFMDACEYHCISDGEDVVDCGVGFCIGP